MLKIKKLEHRFIRSTPRELDVGVIYINGVLNSSTLLLLWLWGTGCYAIFTN